MRILLLEPDSVMSAKLRAEVASEGFKVDTAQMEAGGLEVAAEAAHDLILLDGDASDRDGADLCRDLRQRGVRTRIVLLIPHIDPQHRAEALDAGADDCLSKPFDMTELLARVKAQARRIDGCEPRYLRCDGVELDLHEWVAKRHGREVALTRREHAVLALLMRAQDRALSRVEICEAVWGRAPDGHGDVVEVCLSALRRKLQRGLGRTLIETVKGEGWRFGVGAADPAVRRAAARL